MQATDLLLPSAILLSTLVSAQEQVQPGTLSSRADAEEGRPIPYRVIDALDLHVEGTIMLDRAEFSGDSAYSPDLEDGSEVRRAELELEGELWEGVEFEIEYDFSGSNPDFKDFFIEAGQIRAGILKEPFGLEILTQSRHSTFLERSLASGLNPPRSLGLEYFDWSDAANTTWSLGAFKDRETFEGSDEFGDTMFTGRVTKRVWHSDSTFTHFGFAFSQRNVDADDQLRVKQRPEAHLAPSVLDTGAFIGNDIQVLGLEVASVHGPLSFQGELVRTRVDLDGGPDISFQGFYGFASYFLTGESRPYDGTEGIFGRVQPRQDHRRGVAGGAWEIAARYSHLDLDDGAIRGGTLDDVTLGLNWYLSSHTRVMTNYVHSWLEDQGRAGMLLLRLQFDF